MRTTYSASQLTLFETGDAVRDERSTSTFVDNMSLPVHRWFRYSAGFSAEWVSDVLRREAANGRSRVLEPFAGSGTVLLEAEANGFNAFGLEAHPFVVRVARAKLHWRAEGSEFRKFAKDVLRDARERDIEPEAFPPLIGKCYPPDVLSKLTTLKQAWLSRADESPASELTWLALASILRECSPAGTAQWQYVLPRKSKARSAEPFAAFDAKVERMASDMRKRQSQSGSERATLLQGDARECCGVPDGWADLIVTSPPYPNNYDYADATRLEMSFFGELRGWGDLQETVRRHLLRSCTQHVSATKEDGRRTLDDRLLDPIRAEIEPVFERLEKERDLHGGKKPYHAMIAGYFHDMARMWQALRRVSAPQVLACFVIGDSAPYGIHVPVERWLGELAVANGFGSYSFEKTRDRNIKWKNRKHRVPLHEGRLWIHG
jgi:hypothetical protein